MAPPNAARAAPAIAGNDPQDIDSFAAIDNQKNSEPHEKPQAFCILGIDPGLSGAIAFYFPSALDRVAAEDMPAAAGMVDSATLAARIRQLRPDLAVVERVASRPGQGVASTFKFGAAYGAILGILGALQIRTVLVTPTTWKRHFGLDSDKEKSRALALRTFAKSPGTFCPEERRRARRSRLAGSIRRDNQPPQSIPICGRRWAREGFAMTKTFEITNPKILRKNSLIGSFDLEMPSRLIVRGAMLFEKDGKRWVNSPSKEWTKQDGTKGHFPLFEFASREISDKFQNLVRPLAEKALLGDPETSRRREAIPEPRSGQERTRGHWSGPNSGPNDDLPF
jgi:hypothetical protein